jgi:cytochrome c biogenesis protein
MTSARMARIVPMLWRPVRMIWRRLTSMRTALILLFLLAVAAVPGSLLPQRPLNPDKTASYIQSHGAYGRLLDRFGFFDVFGAPWFAAIYLLLFVSLIGCLIPRIRVHARGMIRKPLPAPRNLDRLPEAGRFETADQPPAYAAAARQVLGRRWRITQRDEADGAIALSAEKGYSRETGNLLFHIALLVALVLIAVGRLYSYNGTRIVVQGPQNGFCNTISQYDDWSPGRLAAEGKVRPADFCIWSMDQFVASYDSSGEPSKFAAHITYSDTPTGPIKHTTITVNHPLRINGDRVYLLNHGFAPELTIRRPDGHTVTDTESLVPQDATTLLSVGAFKEAGVPGANQDVGLSVVFAPSPAFTATGELQSISPQVTQPVLAVKAFVGSLNYNGQPQSVYTLDPTKLKLVAPTGASAKSAINDSVPLQVGQTATFADGVQVSFNGWVPWASMQVSHDPTEDYLLLAAVAMVLGLLASLGVRRRRLWLRITPSSGPPDQSPTVVSIGGLARSDSGNFTTEFAALLERLHGVATPSEPGYTSRLHLTTDDPIGAGRE